MRSWRLEDQVSIADVVDPGLAANDVTYAAMIDGRTIHLHYQLIEQRLCRLYPAATVSVSEARAPAQVGAYSPLGRVGQLPENAVRVRWGDVDLAVDPQAVPCVREAWSALNAAGLAWLVELSVGFISFEAGPGTAGWITIGRSDVTRALLGGAGDHLARLWADAQGAAAAFVPPSVASGVLAEYDRRTRGGRVARLSADEAAELMKTLDRASPLTLVRELAAMWQSGWNRSLFIMDSPHDTAPDLDSFETWLSRA